METESIIPLRQPPEDVEREKRARQERLRDEIWQAVEEMKVPASPDGKVPEKMMPLSQDELRVALEGGWRAEDEMRVPARLGERAATFSLATKGIYTLPEDPTEPIRKTDEYEDIEDIHDESGKDPNRLSPRQAGAWHLVLKAASYLKGAPETAEQCLQYAREVWAGKRDWNETEVPRPGPIIPSAPIEEAEAERRRAA